VSARIVELRQGILKKNDVLAGDLRQRFHAAGLLAVNLVSSPGAGKTTFLRGTLLELHRLGRRVAALVGDLETDNDARKLAESGAPVRQINTHGCCHLEAEMIGNHLGDWRLDDLEFLFIENVGNLVCPASFDLGEDLRVALLSVTEGEDKPLKYPDMFAASDLMLLNKSDLLPHLDFDVGLCLANALKINPNLQTLTVSARTGEGVEAFAAWIEANAARHAAAVTEA
jgi:hydrogenase nickel incorporation protein HypB